ncbi:MAG: hypothetical protein JW820_03835 [Spirochaetales bacterium]|nr:hypothetical protein [Spirochaetales bacterium]
MERQGRRRRYWRRQMEAAYRLMLAIQAHPVEECGEPLVRVPQAAEGAGVRVAFSSEKHVRGTERLFFLRSGLVAPFLEAARELNERGWVLKVEDAFRTRTMQKHLALREDIFARIAAKVRWEQQGGPPPLELLRRRIAALIAMSPKVGTHMSGSAVDVSVLRLSDGGEVDRGAPYLELSEKTPMGSPFVSRQARANRRTITRIMARHGFVTYPFEFWHYNRGDALEACLRRSRRPARYGPVDLDPADGTVAPIGDALQPLNRLEELAAMLDKGTGS